MAPALARATRDPFPPTRAAAVAAFAATHRCFTAAECAGRVLPTLCPLTLDPDRSVREQVSGAGGWEAQFNGVWGLTDGVIVVWGPSNGGWGSWFLLLG